MENEIDYQDIEKKYQTKTQIELSQNQVEGMEPYDENLEGWNDVDEEDLL